MSCRLFTTRQWNGEPAESPEITPEWFDVDALPLHRMWQDAEHWLPPALAGETIDVVVVLNEDNETVASVRYPGPRTGRRRSDRPRAGEFPRLRIVMPALCRECGVDAGSLGFEHRLAAIHALPSPSGKRHTDQFGGRAWTRTITTFRTRNPYDEEPSTDTGGPPALAAGGCRRCRRPGGRRRRRCRGRQLPVRSDAGPRCGLDRRSGGTDSVRCRRRPTPSPTTATPVSVTPSASTAPATDGAVSGVANGRYVSASAGVSFTLPDRWTVEESTDRTRRVSGHRNHRLQRSQDAGGRALPRRHRGELAAPAVRAPTK